MDLDATLSALDRLDVDESVDETTRTLVAAALDPDSGLTGVIDGSTVPPDRPVRAAGGDSDGHRTRVFVESIVVEGFRGIGPAVPLDLTPGPGLTVVVGRNGSGKSSFAEAAELALTGDSFRWKGKGTKVWREGWRNLHHDGDRSVSVQVVEEGQPGTTAVRRTWHGGDGLDDAVYDVREPDGTVVDPASLAWLGDIDTYRPFLSYSELGSLLEDGPSKLHDALSSILGLHELVDATAALAAERKSIASTYAARTMRWSGVILALFIVFHILHLTTGTAYSGQFSKTDVYGNVVNGFLNPIVSLVYIVSMVLLGMHLYHGVWSMTQTLGWRNQVNNHLWRGFATVMAVVIAGGNIAIPLAVLAGIVRP